MNTNSARRKSSISTLGKALLGVALLGTFPPSSLRAGPIRHGRPQPRARQARAADGFASFLDGGPMLRARARSPRIPAGLSLAATGGTSVDSSSQGYLQWRRDLNPERFDRYHPRIGPFLASQVVTLPVSEPPPIPTPTLPPISTASPIQVPTLTPIGPPRAPLEQTVPEPSTVVMTLAMVGWGIWWRRNLRRPGRP
jgi:hypothetical protein